MSELLKNMKAKKTTPSAARPEPAIYRLQIRAMDYWARNLRSGSEVPAAMPCYNLDDLCFNEIAFRSFHLIFTVKWFSQHILPKRCIKVKLGASRFNFQSRIHQAPKVLAGQGCHGGG